MGIGGVGTCQHQHVGVCHLLLLVGQIQELLINLVQLLILEVHAVHVQAMFQGRATTACGEHDAVVVNANVLGVHNLVGLHIFQYAVLMYAAAVRKGIAPHDGFVRLNRHVHER